MWPPRVLILTVGVSLGHEECLLRHRNLAGGGMNVHFQAAKWRLVSTRNACRLALFELLVGRQGWRITGCAGRERQKSRQLPEGWPDKGPGPVTVTAM